MNSGTNKDNYEITEEYGTLSVKQIEIIAYVNARIVANSDEKPYDGTPLTNTGYTCYEFPDGYTVTATVEGSQTNVGESENTITSYQILDENGQPVDKPPHQNVSVVPGTLKVTKRPVTLTSATDSKDYDGRLLTNHTVTVSGDGFAPGEGATYDVTGAQLSVGVSDNTFTYTLDANTKAENYNITTTFGTLTVLFSSSSTAVISEYIEFSAGSATKAYDGTPLTNDGITIQSLPEGLTIQYKVEGSQTDVGEGINNVTNYYFLNNHGQLVINNGQTVVNDGKLTVTPAIVVVDCNYGEDLVENHWVDHYPFVRVNGSNAESDGVGYNRFKLYNGDIIEFTITGVPNRDATPGEYHLDHNATIISDNPGNYSVSFINDVVKIISEEDASAPQE